MLTRGDELTVSDPNGREILSVRPRRSLALQGMTELFFESAEPEFDELAPAEFFERFPEGRLHDLRPQSRRRHAHGRRAVQLPHAGTGRQRPRSRACRSPRTDEGADPPVAGEPVVISWDPVTTSHPEIGNPTSAPIRIERYQLVVEREEPSAADLQHRSAGESAGL